MIGHQVIECLPFCLARVQGNWYVLLDQHARRVGSLCAIPVAWRSAAFQLHSMTPKRAARLSWCGDPDTDRIFLFDDADYLMMYQSHWDSYAKRLQILSKIGVRAWPKDEPVPEPSVEGIEASVAAAVEALERQQKEDHLRSRYGILPCHPRWDEFLETVEFPGGR